MRTSQANVLEAVQATQRFLDTYRENLANVELDRGRRLLDDVAAQLREHALVQTAGTRVSQQETVRQQQLRSEIRFEHMMPIAAIARRKLRDDANFAALKTPPRSVRGVRFVTAATDMANAAEPHASTFIEHGLGTNFIAKLRALTNQFESSVVARNEQRGRRNGATIGITDQVKEARSVFRILNAVVRPALGGNGALITEWNAARTISRRSGAAAHLAALPAPSAAAAVPVAEAPSVVPAAPEPAAA